MRSAAHKRRDIARSILPSKSPQSARHDLAAAKRRNRRAVRADLRTLRVEAYDDTAVDVTRTADREINQIRRRRRYRDKLNHFEHWAVRVTREMPIEDRLGWLRSVLPSGLIGDHAMSHLRRIPELRAHEEWHFWTERSEVEAQREARQQARRRRLAADLRHALERPGGHRAVNLALRSIEDDDDPPGLRLHGVHDIGALVEVLIPGHPALGAVRKALAETRDRREGASPPSGGGAP
jgi:hypothetical protein